MSGKKETVLDLGKSIDKSVRVKLSGGREGGRIACCEETVSLANKKPTIAKRAI
jgi:hypothetical protein